MKTLDILVTSRVKLKVVRYFTQSRKGVRIRELARIIDENPANTQRTLRKIAKTGLIEMVDGRYYAKNLYVLTLLQQIDDSQ